MRQRQTGSLLALLVLTIGVVIPVSGAQAQQNRQQQEMRSTNRQLQQQLNDQQRDQQMQFELNQLRGQQMRQQQFQPLPTPPAIVAPQQRFR